MSSCCCHTPHVRHRDHVECDSISESISNLRQSNSELKHLLRNLDQLTDSFSKTNSSISRRPSSSSESSCDCAECMIESSCLECSPCATTCCCDCSDVTDKDFFSRVNYRCEYQVCGKCLEVMSVETNGKFIKLGDKIENEEEAVTSKKGENTEIQAPENKAAESESTEKKEDEKGEKEEEKQETMEEKVSTDKKPEETIDNAVWDALTADHSEEKLDRLKSDASLDETAIKKDIECEVVESTPGDDVPTSDEVERHFARIRLYYESSNKSSTELISQLDQLKERLFELYRSNSNN